MTSKFRWEINADIKQLLVELEAVRMMLENVKTSPQIQENLRQSALLKSAVYSARIEGFTDTVASPKKESQNLVKAYRFVYGQKSPKRLTLGLIRKMHKLAGFSGQWRGEPWAVFNQGGQVVHMAPGHFKLAELMAEYERWVNRLKDPIGVKAAAAQFAFEKIHPFADGNGRVGRLISAFILEKGGYGFGGLAPFEEFIDKNRGDYYTGLEPSVNMTGFIEFFLRALVTQARESLGKLDGVQVDESGLLPRRREMLEVIRDHPECTFDFIARRFMAIKPGTLHFDLAQLMKAGLVRKLGVSRGVVYKAA